MDESEREVLKEELARRAAHIDQRRKQYEGQYDRWPPHINLMRLNDLEVWEFELDILRWELENHDRQ